jgi:hypothetical protein
LADQRGTPVTIAAITESAAEKSNDRIVADNAFRAGREELLAAGTRIDVRPTTVWQDAVAGGIRSKNFRSHGIGAHDAHLAALESVIEEYWKRIVAECVDADHFSTGRATKPTDVFASAVDATLTRNSDEF